MAKQTPAWIDPRPWISEIHGCVDSMDGFKIIFESMDGYGWIWVFFDLAAQ